MGAIDLLLSLSIPAVIIIHLLVAPYTKVEESFNIQATHDILVYGTPTKGIYEKLSTQYDHFDFPGAVPRTFVGPIFLAGIGQPIISLVGFQHAQLVVRGILGLINAAALLIFKSNVEKAFGRPTARWYALLQATQFHVMFYASRTLPNMFAFPLTTMAFAQLMPHGGKKPASSYKLAIAYLTMAAAIFRSELAILLATTTLYGLLVPHISIQRAIPPFIVFFLFSLLVTVPVDSYFWQKPLWPELWGFYYNAVLGSSSNWGVSPWHYYFTSAIPKILTNPLSTVVLIPLAAWHPATRRQARALLVPALAFVAVYSAQPHKEARFIFYVGPPLTAAAALGANHIFARRTKSAPLALASLALAASVALSLAASAAMLAASSLNYPGGEALAELRALVVSPPSSPDLRAVAVHTDVLACMTGVTLFGQHTYPPNEQPPPLTPRGEEEGGGGEKAEQHAVALTFDKTEDEAALANPRFWERFDYVLAEDPRRVVDVAGNTSWETVGAVEGFAGVEVLRPGMGTGKEGGKEDVRVLGRGAAVRRLRDAVRARTGGWWVGPKMVPKVYILRRMREGEARRTVTA
ncbi:Alg9-like mannosyltransferase [Biscogniauxia mediterranea]|nr:Alg9-like mannosyltransferase [Biscogniauxia mediterranea]